jgi:hypothetical protein
MDNQLRAEIAAVKSLGEKIGYGQMMSIASALWRDSLKKDLPTGNGAFVPAVSEAIKRNWKGDVAESVKQYDAYVEIFTNEQAHETREQA